MKTNNCARQQAVANDGILDDCMSDGTAMTSKEEFPCLSGLRLEPEDWRALAVQGHVSSESRGNRSIYKIRFRRAGRQIVRYIGSRQKAAAVGAELQQLQANQRDQRELRALGRAANRRLRAAKEALAPLLAEHGYGFHGLAIRRRRSFRPRTS